MGVSMDKIEHLFGSNICNSKIPKVLDIGCSNLHTGSVERYRDFIVAYNPTVDIAATQTWAKLASTAGMMDPEIGGINGLWLGDLLTRAGMKYRAFDIFSGYKTELFDLNHQQLEPTDKGNFDIVLNFGTTEHLLGQYNAFKVIHEAAAVGGLIYHDLPMTGYLDHGYFCYNPMLFVQLAEANHYEIVQLQFTGSLGGESISKVFGPKYEKYDSGMEYKKLQNWTNSELPTASVSAIFRKTRDAPFRASLETSTTVGGVTDNISSGYGNEEIVPQSEAALARIQDLLRRSRDPSITFQDVMSVYNESLSAALPDGSFPPTLELLALELGLKENPNETSMQARLIVVKDLQERLYPLLRYLPKDIAANVDLTFDGLEDEFLVPVEDDAVVTSIFAAYAGYREKTVIDLFPPRLELIGLEALSRMHPADKDILLRLGKVSALALSEFP